jgi:hypothetical protein
LIVIGCPAYCVVNSKTLPDTRVGLDVADDLGVLERDDVAVGQVRQRRRRPVLRDCEERRLGLALADRRWPLPASSTSWRTCTPQTTSLNVNDSSNGALLITVALADVVEMAQASVTKIATVTGRACSVMMSLQEQRRE